MQSGIADFENRMRKAYGKFYKSVTVGKEHDTRGRFIQHVIQEGLGYPEDCYLNEKDWADILLLDRPPVGIAPKGSREPRFRGVFPIVIIETKEFNTPNNKLLTKENYDQASGYARKTRAVTRYTCLTNFKRFAIWEVSAPNSVSQVPKPIVDVDLEAEHHHSVFSSKLRELACISYEEVLRTYDDFAVSASIDLSSDENFNLFTSVVKWKILDETLIPLFRTLAEKLLDEYQDYETKHKQFAYLKNANNASGSADRISVGDIDRQIRLLESSYQGAIRLHDNYVRWELTVYSPVSKAKKEERIEKFARETSYTLLSRMLLVRIAESKGLLRQKLSDGGLLSAVGLITQVNEAFKHVLYLAFKDARYIYEHLFLDGIYDWYWEKDGLLNSALKKCLWYLNQYDFSNIKRDVFKHVYQHHMSLLERKRIGEYYTPDEVVWYILDRVGIVSSEDLRQIKILDPACGSGTFLIETINRVKEMAINLSPKEILYMVAGRKGETAREKGNVFGFDIMPFAVYLCESNLLFQVINEIAAIKKKDPSFALDKFQVYRTNSLLPISQEQKMDAYLADIDSEEIESVRRMVFDKVIGNPPYVEVENLRDKKKEILHDLKTMFPSVKTPKGRLELYIAFLARSVTWLKSGGKLGFIVSSKFLSTQNGKWLRELILNECVIEEIVDLMRVHVFEQDVYPLILILRKEQNSEVRNNNCINVRILLTDQLSFLNEIKTAEIRDSPDYDIKAKFICYSVPQLWFKSNFGSVFELNCSRTLKRMRDKVTDPASTLPLNKIMDVRQGVIAGGDQKWRERLRQLGLDEYGQNFTVTEADLCKVPASDRPYLKKLVNGDSVGSFVSNWRTHPLYLVYDPEHLTAPREPSVFEQDEKLILMAKPRFLQASLDHDSIYVTNDTYIARWRDDAEYKPNIKYMLALLNSKVLDLFYKIRHCEYVRGGWFVRYGVFFDELPIKKVNADQEKEIVSLVDRIVKTRTDIVTAEEAFASKLKMLKASRAPTTTGGLSTLIDLTHRTGGDKIVERISTQDQIISFNKDKTCAIKCTSKEAAGFVYELIKEEFASLKNRTLDEVMALIKLPTNAASLHIVQKYIRKTGKTLERAEKELATLRELLDEKVADIYGLGDEINLIRNALKVISGDIVSDGGQSKKAAAAASLKSNASDLV